jgi:hypothetical protein
MTNSAAGGGEIILDATSTAGEVSAQDRVRGRLVRNLLKYPGGLRATYLKRYHASRKVLAEGDFEALLARLLDERRAIAIRSRRGSIWILPRPEAATERGVARALSTPLEAGEELVEDGARLLALFEGERAARGEGLKARGRPHLVSARIEATLWRLGGLGPVTRTALKRSMPEVRVEVLQQALDRLISEGRITVEVSPGRTKPTRLYRLIERPPVEGSRSS